MNVLNGDVSAAELLALVEHAYDMCANGNPANPALFSPEMQRAIVTAAAGANNMVGANMRALLLIAMSAIRVNREAKIYPRVLIRMFMPMTDGKMTNTRSTIARRGLHEL